MEFMSRQLGEEGGGDLVKNPFHGGGMDIVWNTQYINMVIVWNQNVA